MAVNGAREYRPKLHFSPARGWINDPNGPIFDGTRWHLFAQYYPDDTNGGPKHWSHAVSDDLLHWRELPIALYPDEHGMCFSGSAALLDGRMWLMYTSHGDHERQSVAYSDDFVHFTPLRENPVLINDALRDFRDPKLFENPYRPGLTVAIAAGDRVRFYASEDMRAWTEIGAFSDQRHATGVHECPDLFPITAPDGSTVWAMIASMILPGGEGNRTQYLLGDFDGNQFVLTRPFDAPEWISAGWDDYATVTFFGAGARRIAVGWANCWQYGHLLPTGDYAGMMTLPREIELAETRDGLRFRQRPIRELDAITGAYRPIADGAALGGECFRIRANCPAAGALSLVNADGRALKITVDGEEICVDRRKSGECGAAPDFLSEKYALIRAPRRTAGACALEIAFDGCVADVFGEDGLFYASVPVFPETPYTAVRLSGMDASLAPIEA